MLTASPSPRLTPNSPSQNELVSKGYLSPSSHRRRPQSQSRSQSQSQSQSVTASPIVKPHSTHVYPESRYPTTSTATTTISQTTPTPAPAPPRYSSSNQNSFQCSPTEHRFYSPSLPRAASGRSISTQTSADHPSEDTPVTVHRPQMVDAQTQYSPQNISINRDSSSEGPDAQKGQTATPTPATAISRLQIQETIEDSPYQSSEKTRGRRYDPVVDAAMPAAQVGTVTTTEQNEKDTIPPSNTSSSTSTKRNHSVADARPETFLKNDTEVDTTTATRELDSATSSTTSTPSSSKRARPEDAPLKMMPHDYSLATPRDLTILISSMLMELIRYNDSLPLSNTSLTRFHSRAPPGISVQDYLHRLTTHATLSPPILLSMVYYIDKLCALYPAFTISSLTVHRFLITAATVASKGLSDSFWTNRTYAKVGGVSVKELALLELEFLVRVQWRIVPPPEVLVDYYRSLIGRASGYMLESTIGKDSNGQSARVDGAEQHNGSEG